MFASGPTQENLARLRDRGFIIVEPEEGRLASGRTGKGRLAEPEVVVDVLRGVLGREGALKGKKVVVTAGGTRAHIDPVRFIGNPSTGLQGVAVAAAARDRGARVTLVLGRHEVRVPAGMEVVSAPTFGEMREAVLRETADCHALVMAAAVGDYEPARYSDQKIKKTGSGLTIELRQNPDFLLELKGDFVRVAFAAETEDLKAGAARKLAEKKVDAIVANDVSAPGAGFGSPTNTVSILRKGGKWEDVPPGPKEAVAERVIDLVVELLAARR